MNKHMKMILTGMGIGVMSYAVSPEVNFLEAMVGGPMEVYMFYGMYKAFKRLQKGISVPTETLKNVGATVAVQAMKVLDKNSVTYAENLEDIKEGKKDLYPVKIYESRKKHWYYKELASVFGVTHAEMVDMLHKSGIISGTYPNIMLRKCEYGEWTPSENGREYIMYNNDCIEYLRVMYAVDKK